MTDEYSTIAEIDTVPTTQYDKPTPPLYKGFQDLMTKIDPQFPTDAVVKKSSAYMPSYGRFEVVRTTKRNPFIIPSQTSKATGLEGYWVGSGAPPQEVLDTLLNIGYTAHQEIVRRNEYHWGFGQKVTRTLNGTHFDAEVLPFLEDLFLWTMDAAREYFDPNNKSAQQYREDNTKAARKAFRLKFDIVDSKIGAQHITMPFIDAPKTTSPIEVQPTMLDAYERTYYQLLTSLGMLGHPLIRSMQDMGILQAYLPFIVRDRRIHAVR